MVPNSGTIPGKQWPVWSSALRPLLESQCLCHSCPQPCHLSPVTLPPFPLPCLPVPLSSVPIPIPVTCLPIPCGYLWLCLGLSSLAPPVQCPGWNWGWPCTRWVFMGSRASSLPHLSGPNLSISRDCPEDPHLPQISSLCCGEAGPGHTPSIWHYIPTFVCVVPSEACGPVQFPQLLGPERFHMPGLLSRNEPHCRRVFLWCWSVSVYAFRSVSDAGWAFVLGRCRLDSSAGRRCAGPAVVGPVIILVLSEAKNYRKVRSVSVGNFA